jgi:ribosomal-protein-alanine N-acetyltransferase
LILPPYDSFPTIKDDQVVLRQIDLSDINDIIEISFYDSIQATTLEEAVQMQKKINMDYEQGNSIHWGIVMVSSNTIIGSCGYYRGFEKQFGELGFVLLPKYRGRGLMSAALKLAIDFGESQMKLNRIWASTSKENSKAIKLLEGLNFIKSDETDDDEVVLVYSHKIKHPSQTSQTS